MLKLIPSIKRKTFRDNDPRSARADAEYQAKRALALARGRFTCQGCGYQTSGSNGNMDIHHADDNHHNNQDDNLVCACHTCHPYQHVGQIGTSKARAENMGDKTLLVSVPELSPSDFNLLQRAIGAALLDPKEAQTAKRLFDHLSKRTAPVKADFGTFLPASFAAAMAHLSAEDYDAREEIMSDLRLIFSEPEIEKLGRELLADNPSMPVASWASIERSVMSRKIARPQS